MSDVEPFDLEIKKIEGEIVDFLLSNPLFALEKSIISTIKAYFITRKNLTQDMIHKLTGFSRGKISQELKNLVEMSFIEKTNISSMGEITYSMKSATKAFLINFLNAQKDIYEFYNEINDLKTEMEAERSELESLYGYKDLYDIISLFTISLPLTSEIIKILEKELIDLT